jgi:indolepyruvate ferredoxin oxidoreductase, beta subunit
VEQHRDVLRPAGILLTPGMIAAEQLPNRRSMNVALLGALSRRLAIETRSWHEAIERNFRENLRADNLRAFQVGREYCVATG